MHDVAGPEDWAKKRMEQGLGPEELSTFYDDVGPTATLKARRKARADAVAAAVPVKVPKWKVRAQANHPNMLTKLPKYTMNSLAPPRKARADAVAAAVPVKVPKWKVRPRGKITFLPRHWMRFNSQVTGSIKSASS